MRREPATGVAHLELLITQDKGAKLSRKPYRVHILKPDPEIALIAYRLTNVEGDVFYDVALRPDGNSAHCTCPDYAWCREKYGQECKHILALRAVGLLPNKEVRHDPHEAQ